jgi:predicted enzyme related to lactoylglutathione lyase
MAKVVWHDLMTLDGPRARAFYTELFAWKLVPMEMQGFTVWLIENGGKRIGTIMEEKGIPSSHWMPYLAVGDADEACTRAAALGGRVCVKPMELPKLGRFAVLDDPQRAFFSVLRRPDGTEPPPRGPGCFVHDTLRTSAPDDAARFYGELVGWQWEKMGEEHWRTGDVSISREREHAPNWFPHIGVEDVDASAERARKLGAKVVFEPRVIPYAGRFTVLVDPTGAVCGLLRPQNW